MANKKGIELGINFIVILVLAVAVFVLGFAFIFNALNSANDLLDRAKPRINEELGNKIANGETVAVYPEMLMLNRGESGVFGIGIFNSLTETRKFYVNRYLIITDESGNPVTDEFGNWLPATPKYIEVINSNDVNKDPKSGNVKPNEYRTLAFLVKISRNTPKSTYIINIDAFSSDKSSYDIDIKPYPPLKKVYVTVP